MLLQSRQKQAGPQARLQAAATPGCSSASCSGVWLHRWAAYQACIAGGTPLGVTITRSDQPMSVHFQQVALAPLHCIQDSKLRTLLHEAGVGLVHPGEYCSQRLLKAGSFTWG